MLKAERYGEGRLFPTERGTPQGGVISPLLSNILLTPFDQEMRRRGYRLTRYADDWVITCSSAAEARAALEAATRIVKTLGVHIHPQKTRIVHVRHGLEFLGYKIKRGRRLTLPVGTIRSGARSGAFYAFPRQKSVQHFKDQVRRLTRRKAPVSTEELIKQINPVVRGWGHHFKRAQSAGSSTNSTAGSFGASGRTTSNDGDVVVGGSYRGPNCRANWGWSTLSARSLPWHLGGVRLRESRMRESCTSGLSGGRWPASERGASSDPTAVLVSER